MPVISIIYIFMIKRKKMPRGRGARMLGPVAGRSGSGTARGRPLGTGKPRAAPSPASWPAGTRKGWGQPPGGPCRKLAPGPSLFLPLEPTWGTDCRRRSIYRSCGDQEQILASRENLGAWAPGGYCQLRRRGRPVTILSNRNTPGGLVGLGVRDPGVPGRVGEWWAGHH